MIINFAVANVQQISRSNHTTTIVHYNAGLMFSKLLEKKTATLKLYFDIHSLPVPYLYYNFFLLYI